MKRKITLILFLILSLILTDADAQEFSSPPLKLTNNDLLFAQNSPFDQLVKKRKSRRNKNKRTKLRKDIVFVKGSLFLQGRYGISDFAGGMDTVSNSPVYKFGPYSLSAEYAVYHNIGLEVGYAGFNLSSNSTFAYQTFDEDMNLVTQQLDIDLHSALSTFSLSVNFHILPWGDFLFIPGKIMKKIDINYGFGPTYFSESYGVNYNSQYLGDVSTSDKYWGINMKISIKYFVSPHIGIFYETHGLAKGYFDDILSTNSLGVVYKFGKKK